MNRIPTARLPKSTRALQEINPQFEAIAKQVRSLDSIGAYHLGDQPPGTVRLPGSSPFTLSPTVSDTTYVDSGINSTPVEGMLIGLFGDGSQLADAQLALIVNLDYVNGVTTTVNGPGLLSVFDATSSIWTPTGQTSALLNIDPGGGILVGLTSAIPSLTGDFDGDSDVDGADFLKWQRDGGSASGLAVWEANYGTSAIVSASAAVPEPSCHVLLLAAGAVLAARRQR